MWLCRCVCGIEKEWNRGAITSGNTKSCGCKWVELHTKHGHTSESQGRGRSTSTYRAWRAMKRRCYNPNDSEFENYGARGITVCDRWLESFINFLQDMGDCPIGMSIDRIKNNESYCKENCRWIPMFDQQANKRTNVMITINGQTKHVAGWSRTSGLNPVTIRSRINLGWTGPDLIIPVGSKRTYSKSA